MTHESSNPTPESSNPEFWAAGKSTPHNKYRESPPAIKCPEEDVLIHRDKISETKIGRGVTDSSFIELKDDGKAVFKTIYFENERAAYLIDRFLGINLTPPTAIRTIAGQTGSMQEYIPDAKMFFELSSDEAEVFISSHRLEFMKMWIFDIIIGNIDRHGGNLLKQGELLFAIDHGHSVNIYEDDFLRVIHLWSGYRHFFDEKIPLQIIQPIKNFLDRPEEQQLLLELLTELYGNMLASACIKRIRIIGEILIKNGIIARELGNEIPIN